MQRRVVFGIFTLALLSSPGVSEAQNMGHMNPMVTLMEQGLPVLGMTHPAITAGRGGGAGRGGAAANPAAAPVTPPPPPVLSDVARQTMAYSLADFEYNSYSPANAERFAEYMRELIKAGGTAKAHPFISKIPIVHADPASAQARIIEQMNAGHVGVFMQQVETAAEVQQTIAAMRFRSRGGIRPDEGVALAAALWGLTEEQYRDKADVWPINPNGELVIIAIIESKEGIANARQIAAIPGVSSLTVGAGTLGGVFSSTNAAGERVRDQAGFDAGVEAILAACKEFKKACGYPANNPTEIESLMARGFSLFTMQSRNDAAFEAILAGRRLSGRSLTP